MYNYENSMPKINKTTRGWGHFLAFWLDIWFCIGNKMDWEWEVITYRCYEHGFVDSIKQPYTWISYGEWHMRTPLIQAQTAKNQIWYSYWKKKKENKAARDVV